MTPRASWLLAAWFTAATALDVATTHIALALGAEEANPAMAAVLDAAGTPGVAGIKAVVVAASMGLLAWENHRRPKRAWVHYAVIYGATATTLVAAWNAAQILLHGAPT